MARAALAVFFAAAWSPLGATEIGIPADCELGRTCFFQQFADMQLGPGAVDPFCGGATHEGHDGTDLRVLSMADVALGVPVIAMAKGTVLRVRDGEPDHLVVTELDRAAVTSKECGNGLVIDHGLGMEIQYCHLRQGSVIVAPGDQVVQGAKLGEIGASGLAQFPHVHVTVRVNGNVVDPFSGRALSEGCASGATASKPLLSTDVIRAVGKGAGTLIAAGLAAGPIDHAKLAQSGPPASATAASPNLVGWAWFINLQKDDRVRLVLKNASGHVLADTTSDPLDRNKASWSSFAGKRGAPAPGMYMLSVSVIRGDALAIEQNQEFEVR
jgi:hypothetical protein